MGETWYSVKQKFPNSNLTALDFSEQMMEEAQIKNKKKYKNNVKLLQQDILKNQLPSDYYDIVICAFGLKTFNAEQLKSLATETKRILKDGGQFSFIEVSKPKNRFKSVLQFLS
jgi:ubiquinone/menaquinone biosynthesis C-methylase UbiE